MIEVKAEGDIFYYHPSAQFWDIESIKAFLGGKLYGELRVDAFILEKIQGGLECRIIIDDITSPHRPKTKTSEILMLYWVKDFDSMIDTKVVESTYTDEDFRFSIKTRYQTVFCTTCNWAKKCLVFSDVEYYIKVRQLYMQKLDYAFDNVIRKCPQCGASMRLFVVKILED